MDEKVRENRLRRVASRRGYLLRKSRRRDPQAIDFGGYMLVDARGNFTVVGGLDFSATLDEIESFLNDEARKGAA